MILYRQYVRAERKTFFGLAIAVIAALLLSVGTFRLFEQSGTMAEIQKMLADLPGPLKSIFLQEFSFTVIDGWLINQFWRVEFPLIMAAATAIGTVAVLTKEADQGTLSFLLALPVSRTQVVLQRFGAFLTGLGLLHLIIGVAVHCAMILFDFPPHWTAYGLMALGAFLAQAAVAGLVLLVTVFLDDAPIATAVSLVLSIGLFFLTLLLKTEGWQLALRRLSPFHYYEPGAILKTGALDGTDLTILLLIFAAATVGALLAFNRKQVSS